MSAPVFTNSPSSASVPEAAGSVAITFDIPAAERSTFDFQPGQFLTLRAKVDGQDVRRNYSISSPKAAWPGPASWKSASARSRAACSPTGRRKP